MKWRKNCKKFKILDKLNFINIVDAIFHFITDPEMASIFHSARKQSILCNRGVLLESVCVYRVQTYFLDETT